MEGENPEDRYGIDHVETPEDVMGVDLGNGLKSKIRSSEDNPKKPFEKGKAGGDGNILKAGEKNQQSDKDKNSKEGASWANRTGEKAKLATAAASGNIGKLATAGKKKDLIMNTAKIVGPIGTILIIIAICIGGFLGSQSTMLGSLVGNLQGSYRYENIPHAALGRMGFRFDEDRNLVVIGTLERETGRKVNLQGLMEDFDKESVGVVWMRFVSGSPESKIYLFKDMPEIEHALTASDRVRVREERLKNQKKDNPEKGEIAFQFLTPRMTDFDSLTVFAVEAFMPYYHTETRTSYGYYGYYGGYPYTYTVFDGYDFFSEVLLAFDRDGHLKWQQSVKFENELTYDLFPHGSEGVCFDELVVASPYRNNLRYTAFDAEGQVLMSQQNEKLAPIHGADYVEDEYFAQMAKWYGNRFLIYGSQIIQNSTQPKPRRTVFYLQKVQYD